MKGSQMEYKEAYWEPEEGERRFYRCWQPPYRSLATVVIIHGYGEHSGRYHELAEALTQAGITVMAPDLYGHGLSSGTRAYVPGMKLMVAEIHNFLLHVVKPTAGAPIFMLGHSMGGALALLYALRHQELLEGLMLSGAAVRTGGEASLFMRIAAMITAAIAPRLPLAPFDAEGISRNQEVVREYIEDPLVYSGKMRARTAVELLKMEKLVPPSQLAGLRLPVLLWHGAKDPIVPSASSDFLYHHIGAAEKTYERFSGAYHEVHHEAERETLFPLISSWIKRLCKDGTARS